MKKTYFKILKFTTKGAPKGLLKTNALINELYQHAAKNSLSYEYQFFKPLSISKMTGKFQKEEDRKISFVSPVEFYIGGEENLVWNVACEIGRNGLFQTSIRTIQSVDYFLREEPTHFIANRVAVKNEEGRWITFEDEEFEETVQNSTLSKLGAFFSEDELKDVYIRPVYNHPGAKTEQVYLKEDYFVIANNIPFEIDGPIRVKKAIAALGLGGKTSSGFGHCYPVREYTPENVETPEYSEQE